MPEDASSATVPTAVPERMITTPQSTLASREIRGGASGAEAVSLDAAACPLDAAGCPLDAAGCPLDAAGCPLDAAGCPLDAAGCPLDAAGCPLDAQVCVDSIAERYANKPTFTDW